MPDAPSSRFRAADDRECREPGASERGKDAAEQRRYQDGCDDERQHSEIDCGLIETRKIGSQQAESRGRGCGDNHAGDASGAGEHCRLRERLRHERRLRGAKSAPHSKFATAFRPAGQQEGRYVGARDDEKDLY